MSRTIRFRRAAQREFDDAVDWYEGEEPGLGARFYLAVKRALAELVSDPSRHAIVFKKVRLAPVPEFKSYTVYYEVGRKYIHIISVFHQSRNPAVWQSRV